MQLQDRFSFIKFIFIVISIGGTVLISSSVIQDNPFGDDVPMVGAAWALVRFGGLLSAGLFKLENQCCELRHILDIAASDDGRLAQPANVFRLCRHVHHAHVLARAR